MISTTPQKAKFRLFIRKMRPILDHPTVDPETICIGILERLWHAACTSAIRGDIGRLSDDLIAEMLGWRGDAQQLIEILVECGWLDESEEYRLLVHDWADHAPRHVKGNAAKVGGIIPTKSPEGQAPKAPPLRPRPKGQAPGDGRTNSIQFKSIQTPVDSSIDRSTGGSKNGSKKQSKTSEYTDDFERFWATVPTRGFSKAGAFNRWKQAIRKVDPDKIIDAGAIYAKSERVQRGFAMNPANWLSGECWENDYTEPASNVGVDSGMPEMPSLTGGRP